MVGSGNLPPEMGRGGVAGWEELLCVGGAAVLDSTTFGSGFGSQFSNWSNRPKVWGGEGEEEVWLVYSL